MNKNIPKWTWILLAYIFLLGFNYLPEWGFYFSFISFISLMLCLKMAWEDDWKTISGLDFSQQNVIVFITGLTLLVFINYFFINSLTISRDINFVTRITSGDKLLYIHTFFQTLNEEILMGAVLLFALQNKSFREQPLFLSIAIGAVFSISHYFTYRYVFIAENGVLSYYALFSLFAVGVIRNNLILRTNNIAYSWMIHLAWNWVFFGGNYYINGLKLMQVEQFNIIFGNEKFLIAASIIMIITSVSFDSIRRLNTETITIISPDYSIDNN